MLRKIFFVLYSIVLISVGGIFTWYLLPELFPGNAHDGLQLASTALEQGGNLSGDFVCRGKFITPPFKIYNVPENTKSFALLLYRPNDLPKDPSQWLVYNIAADTRLLPEGLMPGEIGINQKQSETLLPLCPKRDSRIRFTVLFYALDAMYEGNEKLNYSSFTNFVNEHEIQAYTVSFYVIGK